MPLFILGIIIPVMNASGQDFKNYNGWEFLTWKAKKDDVEKILKQKSVEPQSYDFKKPLAYALIFTYGDFKTECDFDSIKKLVKVSQHIDFSIGQDNKSKEFFDNLIKEMEIKYGRIDKKSNNLIDEITTIDWKLTFTKIHLVYDYKYKVVDEMGCCSYTIDIDFEPLE